MNKIISVLSRKLPGKTSSQESEQQSLILQIPLAAISSRRLIRSSMGGCVANSF